MAIIIASHPAQKYQSQQKVVLDRRIDFFINDQ
jgi:hypothetical protein